MKVTLYKENKDSALAIAKPEPKPESIVIPDPCLQQGLTFTDIFPDIGNVSFYGTGQYHQCKKAVLPLTNKSLPCEAEPCSMNGVYQPGISFHNTEFYGFSELWYTMEDVFRIGGAYEYDDFDKHAEVNICIII